jgi:hypothetical protein
MANVAIEKEKKYGVAQAKMKFTEDAPGRPTPKGGWVSGALMRAAEDEEGLPNVRGLVESSANEETFVNAQSPEGYTALMLAHRHPECVAHRRLPCRAAPREPSPVCSSAGL